MYSSDDGTRINAFGGSIFNDATNFSFSARVTTAGFAASLVIRSAGVTFLSSSVFKVRWPRLREV